MTLFWLIGGSLESMPRLQDMENERPPRFEFANLRAVHEYGLRVDDAFDGDDDAERELLEFDGMPMPVFRIADPTFRLDYFDQGIRCVSLRLREAFGLASAVVRYRDVDLDGSPPALRAQQYQAFHVVAFADLIDWNRTAGQALDVPRPDGSIRKLWRLAPPNPVGSSRRIYWRDNFTPPAPLFRVAGTSWTVATDSLADRVMRAGITDLVLQDVTSDRAQTELVLRAL